MKKILLLVLAGGLTMFSSCEKFLTHDNPIDVYDEIWWNTEANVTSALNSVYAGIPDGSSGRQFMFLDAMSDNAVARQSLRGDYEAYVKGLQGANWGVGRGIWDDDYRDIRRANRFLENMGKAYMTNDEIKNRYPYEARALRAYYHMELSMFFGGITIMKESVSTENSYLPRNTAKEVYDFVIAELTECASNNNLPNKYKDNVDLKRISAATCWGLISKYAIYNKDYVLARDAAKKIIDMGEYSLRKSATLKSSYADLFLYTGEINNERIFLEKIHLEETSGILLRHKVQEGRQ
jgi:hypothetical protein